MARSSKTVTALRELPRGRVLVQVDGHDWRVLPTDAVVRAGLSEGTELDRERVRELARERRRSAALAAAGAMLRVRDLSVRALEDRLARRGIAPTARADALAALERGGMLDDTRFARNRAHALAARGAADAGIRLDLERRGLAAEVIEKALEGLELEHLRAARIVSGRGRSPATARFLTRKGFAQDSIETALGGVLA